LRRSTLRDHAFMQNHGAVGESEHRRWRTRRNQGGESGRNRAAAQQRRQHLALGLGEALIRFFDQQQFRRSDQGASIGAHSRG
jgi:hypothetical protein